jgi:uncharacterized protein (DUF362 family)/Pyruvate/2-oxoacid:ferredoxin oxidoreductase delta subunit
LHQETNKTQVKTDKSIVSIRRCDTYDSNLVEEKVRELISEIGGIEQFVKPGDKVHLKPNLLTAKSPDRAATTHPSVVRAVAKIIKEAGAEITLGDSPAGITRPIEEYWKNTGMEDVAQELDLKLVRFEKSEVAEKNVGGTSYFIAKVVAEADVVINLCKMKTHNLVLYTGAIKNMFGCIPGFRKSEYHKQAPKPHNFAQIIVDVFSAVKPELSIMDGIVAMEGNGPSAGNPKKMGLLFASTDAVALDSVASRLMGFEDGEIETTEIAYQRGLGKKHFSEIEIRGDHVSMNQDISFSLPSNRYLNYVPSSLVRILGKLLYVRPKPDSDRCKRCGICIANCPVQAMTPKKGFPIIDYKKCISCFCCDEVCPFDAIDQDISWLAKKFR